MRPEVLLVWLRAQPFRPFRIHLTNGSSFDVRHPELVLLERSYLTIGSPAADLPGTVDRTDMIGLLHINHIEPLPVPPPAGNGAGQPA